MPGRISFWYVLFWTVQIKIVADCAGLHKTFMCLIACQRYWHLSQFTVPCRPHWALKYGSRVAVWDGARRCRHSQELCVLMSSWSWRCKQGGPPATVGLYIRLLFSRCWVRISAGVPNSLSRIFRSLALPGKCPMCWSKPRALNSTSCSIHFVQLSTPRRYGVVTAFWNKLHKQIRKSITTVYVFLFDMDNSRMIVTWREPNLLFTLKSSDPFIRKEVAVYGTHNYRSLLPVTERSILLSALSTTRQTERVSFSPCS
jgi:hypothetical protein